MHGRRPSRTRERSRGSKDRSATREGAGLTREDAGFFRRVYALVRRVPRGRVVTYGQVAAMLGVPHGARAVGWALRALSEEEASRVPWHRVLGAGGRISPRAGLGPRIQRHRLRAERVAFLGSHVDLARHGLLAAPARPPVKRVGLTKRAKQAIRVRSGKDGSAALDRA